MIHSIEATGKDSREKKDQHTYKFRFRDHLTAKVYRKIRYISKIKIEFERG